MSEHEHDPKAEERIEDLDVPESESDEVKGGLNFSKIEVSSKISQKISGGGLGAQKISPNLGQFGDGSV